MVEYKPWFLFELDLIFFFDRSRNAKTFTFFDTLCVDLKKKIVICDRFTDSTLAYQVYGKKVDRRLVDSVHKYILGNIKPDITFILKVNISKALNRLKKRKKKNRYDKFSKKFYYNVQKAFIKIAKKNKKKYFIIDNNNDNAFAEKAIYKIFLKFLKK